MPKAAASFPPGFLWGTATASHQIEGGNVNNDWWDFEHDPDSGCTESSGDACDSLHRWREDVDLVAGLGLNAYRFSLEWSRIEPAEGEWSRASLDYYRRICAACRERGLEPFVTFCHYTLPRWFAARGGWESVDATDTFGRYVARAVEHLGDLIGGACTLNEPNVASVLGYTMGLFPPGLKDRFSRAVKVNDVLVRAHRRAVEELRSGPGTFPVGLTLSMADIQPAEGGEAMAAAALEIEDVYLRGTEGDDFVGAQGYTRRRLGPKGVLAPEPGVRLTQMGYEYWPQVIEAVVRRAAQVTGIPVIVTESGIGTDDDGERIDYLTEALRGVLRCLADGVDLRGFFAWSLMDNFEWAHGCSQRFGLVHVDFTTQKRIIKDSGKYYAAVAAGNAVL